MKSFQFLFFLILVTVAFQGCKKGKDNDPEAGKEGTVKLTLLLKFKSDTLRFNQPYISSAGDTIVITKFRFYFSRFTLLSPNNDTLFEEVNSYHLLDYGDASRRGFTLTPVPYGNYARLGFAIGVDSSRNHTLSSIPDLNPTYGMHWDTLNGYIFIQIEGTYNGTPLSHHIGGDAAYRTYNIPLPIAFSPANYKTYEIIFSVDLDTYFSHLSHSTGGFPITIAAPGTTANDAAMHFGHGISVPKINIF
jgi:hypothetical protein